MKKKKAKKTARGKTAKKTTKAKTAKKTVRAKTAKKSTKRKAVKKSTKGPTVKKAMVWVKNPSFDLCAGAQASSDSTTLTFTNNRPFQCNAEDDGSGQSLIQLTGLSSISVPARSGSTPGQTTVTITGPAGTYTYQSPCCDDFANPTIVYQ